MDNDRLYVKDVNTPDPWEGAKADLQAWLDDFDNGYVLPDLQIEDASNYEASGQCLVISFSSSVDYDEKAEELNASLAEQGFHYSHLRECYLKEVDSELNAWFCIYVYATDEGVEVYLEINEYDSEIAYGLAISYIDDEGYFSADAYYAGEDIGEDSGYHQYFIDDAYFYEGAYINAYDFINEREFAIEIDPWSFGQNVSTYLEYDEELGAYLVKQDFTADVYIKLKYGEDKLYLELVE